MVLKILIVDDEMLERKAVSKIIQSSVDGVTVVAEAPNGRKAIEMADEHTPDIIFMDIKMPGIDGVQAVKEIRKRHPSVKFIMVSAFNTFEYAKEVMQQGVKEYLLKPSSKQDILEAVQRVSEDIRDERRQREERQSLQESLERAVSIARKEWVSSLLLNQVQDITFDEWGQLLGFEITSGYIMLFSLQSAEESSIPMHDKRNWYAWLKDSLKSIATKQEVMIGPLTDTQVPVLFLCKKLPERVHVKSSAESMIKAVISHFQKESFQGDLRIGVGLPYSEAHELNKSYHEAVWALQQLSKAPEQKYAFSKTRDSFEERSPSLLLDMEKKLLDAVRQGDANQMLMIFDSFVVQHVANRNIQAEEIKRSFDELFVLISRMLHEFGIGYERVPRIEESEDIGLMLETCKGHLMNAVYRVQVWRNNHAKGMLYKAKEYIEQHYADAITLESVAEHVEISPYYFSKLFKDRFGMTFIDYVTEIRIQRAKEEMADPGKSLKEICFSIGYKDPNYFSRVFKKHTGLSPTQFRKAILEEYNDSAI